jgi:hypothetical protein
MAVAEWSPLVDLSEEVEDLLNHLRRLTAITAAHVVLEYHQEARTAFRVQVQLEVPGPSTHAQATRPTRQAASLLHRPALHSNARANTLEAALLKSTQDLEHQIQLRQPRRRGRGGSRPQVSDILGGPRHAQAGQTA